MHNGRMFLCDAGVIPHGVMGGEGSFVMTELGSSSCIHSVSSVLKTSTTQTSVQTGSEENQSSVEIWCGESHGAIAIFTLTGSSAVVTSQEIINHNNPVIEN